MAEVIGFLNLASTLLKPAAHYVLSFCFSSLFLVHKHHVYCCQEISFSV